MKGFASLLMISPLIKEATVLKSVLKTEVPPFRIILNNLFLNGNDRLMIDF